MLPLLFSLFFSSSSHAGYSVNLNKAYPTTLVDCQIILNPEEKEFFRGFVTGKNGLLESIVQKGFYATRTEWVKDAAVKFMGVDEAVHVGGLWLELDRDRDTNVLNLTHAKRKISRVVLDQDPKVWQRFTKASWWQAHEEQKGHIRPDRREATSVTRGYAVGVANEWDAQKRRRFVSFQRIAPGEVRVMLGIDLMCPDVDQFMDIDLGYRPMYVLEDVIYFCRIPVYVTVLKLDGDPRQKLLPAPPKDPAP